MIAAIFLLWLAIKYKAPWWVYIPLICWIALVILINGSKMKEIIERIIIDLKIKRLK